MKKLGGDMDAKVYARRRNSQGGFTLFETLTVIGVIAIVSAITIPQVVGARRLLRAAGVTQELAGGLRDARQMAITRRRAVTFQYDDDAKQVKIIDHGINAQTLGVSGASILTASGYPDTTGSSVVSTVSLATGSLPVSEIAYGVPAGVPTQASTLPDKTTLTTLTNSKLNITFQPDGTVMSSSGATSDFAFAIYNSVMPQETAAAVSILGATGRIKSWRYSKSAQKFVE
jgi:prepilin-type N-terminal cleavage/methylation domain-containing protein